MFKYCFNMSCRSVSLGYYPRGIGYVALSRIFLDKVGDDGVLRHIGDDNAEHAIDCTGDFLVSGGESALHVICGAVVFYLFVAVLRLGDDRNISFGGDVVAQVAFLYIGIQIIDHDLQINCASVSDHVATGVHLFLQHFL